MRRSEAMKLRAQIEQAATHAPDNEAYDAKWMYKQWKPDTQYTANVDRVQYGGILYKCRQNHTSQSVYTPDMIPALWEVVPDPHQSGTHDNPIAFTFGMAVVTGLFYTEDGVLYEGIHDSINPLYNRLADLIGIYVQVAN